MNEVFLFESILTKRAKIKLFFIRSLSAPTRTEPTKEQAVQPAPTRKPTVIRIPAKPGKWAPCLIYFLLQGAGEKYMLIYQCLLLKLFVIVIYYYHS